MSYQTLLRELALDLNPAGIEASMRLHCVTLTISAVVSGRSSKRTPWLMSSHCGSGERLIRIMGNLP